MRGIKPCRVAGTVLVEQDIPAEGHVALGVPSFLRSLGTGVQLSSLKPCRFPSIQGDGGVSKDHACDPVGTLYG
jgi:hypothetical protein